MIVWENGKKFEFNETVVAALKALGVGYGHISPAHAAYLKSFGFCYRGVMSYQITPDGRRALELWEQGHAYDCDTHDRQRRSEPDRAPVLEAPGTGTELPADGDPIGSA